MEFRGSNILSAKQFNRGDIEEILRVAAKMEPYANLERTSDALSGILLASLFYEPSTRTRFSFETAAIRLGARIIGVHGLESSSLKKGESLEDTGRIVSTYADLIVCRHPQEGSVEELASGSTVSVINAGDGYGQHPTQALLDMFTIQKERGKIDGLTVALTGDLKFGRTVHSLAYFLSHFDVQLLLVSPKELKMPQEVLLDLREKGVSYKESEDFAAAVEWADVLYCTRIQEERFTDTSEYERLKGTYVLTRDLLEEKNQKVTVMHPLPRIDEIARDVDQFPGAAYFRQARNGVPVRMALYALLLDKKV